MREASYSFPPENGNLKGQAYKLSAALAVAVILGGLLIIAGWYFHIAALQGSRFGTLIAPHTALLFVLAGISALLQRWPRTLWLGRSLAIGIAVFAAAVALQYLIPIDLGMERWSLALRFKDWTLARAMGRMGWPATIGFLLTGVALAGLRLKTSRPLDMSASGLLIVGYLAIIGYVYGLRPIYEYMLALPTALLFLVTSAMLLCAARESAIRDILLSDDAGGMMLRRMAPLTLILLPMLGWMRLRAQALGLPLEFAVALFVLATILVFTAGALHTAGNLDQLDTQRKRAQAALLRSEKLAAAGRLAATVAHEINNPLAAATNALFLARTAPPEKFTEYITVAERELLRVSAVARQSLGFYRGQSKTETFDAGKALTEVAELLGPAATTKGVKLIRLDGDLLMVTADSGELRQILVNLVSNAIDATSAGGRVEIGASAGTDGYVDFLVWDNGAGIPADLHREIFEPFFTTKSDVGTGLGLFVVKELVAKNHGRIRFESRQSGSGKGTRFTVSLPRAAAKQESVA